MRANASGFGWLAGAIRRALPSLLLLLAPLAQAQDAADPLATEAAGAPAQLELDPADRARLDALPSLRVIADPQAPPVSFMDADGRYVGLVPDYLARMAVLLGVRLQPVPARNWQEALQRFEAGEAELIAPIAVTPDREARMRFSQPLVSFRAVAMARREQPVVERFEDLLGLRFAQIAGTSESRRLRERYPQLVVQDYADAAEALQALSAGQADAVLGNPAVLRYQTRRLLIGNLHVVAPSDEPARQHHLAVRPEQAWLLPLLDRAYAVLPESDKNDIRRRWLDEEERAAQQVLLSAAERDWVAAHAVLRIGYSPSAPITFRDSEGQAAGQAVELVNEVCRRTGLRPDWCYYETWKEAQAALAAREIDALGSVSATRMGNGDPLSRGYMPLQNGLFLHEDAPLASRIQMLGGTAVVVAVSTSSALAALRERHPQQPVLEVASIDEQLEALRDGRAEAAVGNLALLDYEIRRRQLRDLRIGGLFDSPAEAKLAVRADHPLTLSVLNKAIASLSAEQRDAILDRWFRLEQDPVDPWKTARVVAGVLLPALAGLAFLGYWALRLRREVRARKQAEDGLHRAQAQLAGVLARTQGQFQAVLDHAPMAIWAKDLDGRYVQANRAYGSLFGLHGADPLGRRDHELWPLDAVSRFRHEDVEVQASGEPQRRLERTQPGTGEDRRLLKLKFPIHDAGGAVVAVGGIALDVTEQEQLREQLELRNRRLALREEQLLRLSSSTAVDDGDLRETYALVAEAATASLDAERASVWYLDEEREHIVCQWLHDRGRGVSAEPQKLSRAAFPAYFTAIQQERVVAAHEARRDPRTAPFTASYLEPLGIESMLDVAIRHHGQTIGVICVEHDAPRHWSEEDASFVNALADLVARTLTASERRRADDKLRRLNASLEHTVADRTAQARAAERLAQERADKIEAVQQRLRRITDASPGALYQFRRDADGRFAFPFMSAGIEELAGIDWRTATQDAARVFATVLPEDLPGLLASIETSAATLQPYVHVFRVPRPGGGMRWIQARSRPSRDADGGITWDGFLADVTESREQAALVEAAQQRLQTITDSIAGLVYEYRRAPDGSDSASFISDGVGQLIGVRREAVLADVRSFFAVVLPEDLPGYTADILRSAEEHRDHRYSFRIRHAVTGEVRWLYSSARAPHREQGAMVWRGYVIDITEQKRLQEQLAVARDEADQASRAKSEFLANMSHEIRTPMNAVIGLSHLALQTELSPRQHDYLGKIHHSAQSLLGIINDILDLSKIEAGKLAVERAPFDLFEVLENLAGLVGVRAQDKGLEFLISTAKDLPSRLVGDALRIGQVLLNLAGNAVKFTERGQVLLRVQEEYGSREAGAVRLRFEVSDTGIGLSDEQVGRLFQSFSQADASTTRRYGGTGLGLSISRQLVELMGGQIGVDSEPGAGSSFWFVLPLGLAPDQRRGGSEPVPLAGRQVLVVDDNASAREIAGSYLAGFGMRVTQAPDGEAAVEAARAAEKAGTPFDLAVLDWQMPGLDGIATARALRRLDTPPKVILLTAHGREEVARQAEAERLDGFLVKPVNPSLLLDTSLQALVGRGMPGGGGRGPRGFGDGQRQALRGVSVLLAEDNEINQQVAREVLEGFGAAVDIAGNGRIALERLRAGGRYDVVLMDMQMPEMDGLAATRAIRADAALPRLPILAMTANAMEADRRACLDAGMDDFLSKPFRPVELLRLLRHWLYGESAPAQVAAATAEPQLFNHRDGLARVGSEPVLQRLVAQLLASAPLPPLEVALAAGATGEAQRLIHSLSGSTGLLGFERLHEAARAVERALRSGQDAAPPMTALRAAWAEAAGSVRVPSPVSAPPAWQRPDPALLAALAQQIEACDSQANESLDALRAACGDSPPPVLGALERALAEFDFSAAAALLPAVRAVLEEGSE